VLYTCAMEAIQNAVKHARATAIHVALSDLEGCLAVLVHDNGCGFDASAVLAGNGLRNMRDRVAPWQGSVEITSSELGTDVSVRIPHLSRPDEP